MGKKAENSGFVCQNCKKEIKAATSGTYRNHCPFCLYSLHIDVNPGDRACECGGLMKPVDTRYHTQKGWQILHKCIICGFERYNMVINDGDMPDDMDVVRNIMSKIY